MFTCSIVVVCVIITILDQCVSVLLQHFYTFFASAPITSPFDLTMECLANNRRKYRPARSLSWTEPGRFNCEQHLSSPTDERTGDMAVRTLQRSITGRTPHVCVVGAGVAGLRCAEVLLEKGIKVTILEGRDRIGGRVCPLRIRYAFND